MAKTSVQSKGHVSTPAAFSAGAGLMASTSTSPEKMPHTRNRSSGVSRNFPYTEGRTEKPKHYGEANAHPTITKGRTLPKGV